MMSPETDFEADPQDRAEVLDETNLTDDGAELANFDDIDDVYDATAADGDEDDDEFDEDDFDEDEELEAGAEEDYEDDRDDEGLEIEREPLSASAGDEDFDESDVPTSGGPQRYESERLSDEQLHTLGYDDEQPDESDPHVDRQLDKGLKETFPASDPVSINPGAD